MGSYISLTSPAQIVSNSIYAQSDPRVKKNNPYGFLTRWTEHFVDAMSPIDVVFSKIDQDGNKSASLAAESENNENPTEHETKNPGDGTHGSNVPPYAKSKARVDKDNLYMMLALLMQDFPDEEPNDKKAGAVLALPNEVVLAADCSRDGVHAVQRILMQHHDKAEGSKIFLSRKPCSICAKLLVQAKVKQVLYLPLKPEDFRETGTDSNTAESMNERQTNEVGNLFRASSSGLTRFIPHIEKDVVEHAGEKTLKKGRKKNKTEDENEVGELKADLIKKYEFGKDSRWMNEMKTALGWDAFDENMKNQVREYFEGAMEWIARIRVKSGRGSKYDFKLRGKKAWLWYILGLDGFNPVDKSVHKEQARHFMTIAKFLAERSDDPKRGVGAVIVTYPKMEIVALGWNGYPFKAQYGEFPRASDTDEDAEEKKNSYAIHAEQNALLLRNTKNIEGSILFVTKTPCNECAPLIAMEGIKTVVVDQVEKEDRKGYDEFPKMIKDGKFTCYYTYDPKDPSIT